MSASARQLWLVFTSPSAPPPHPPEIPLPPCPPPSQPIELFRFMEPLRDFRAGKITPAMVGSPGWSSVGRYPWRRANTNMHGMFNRRHGTVGTTRRVQEARGNAVRFHSRWLRHGHVPLRWGSGRARLFRFRRRRLRFELRWACVYGSRWAGRQHLVLLPHVGIAAGAPHTRAHGPRYTTPAQRRRHWFVEQDR